MLVQRGSAGNEVILVQAALRAVYYSEVTVDGIFGPITENAVMKFQQSDGRQPTGVVDDELYGRMQEIAGLLIVNRAQMGLPIVQAPYIPSILQTVTGTRPGEISTTSQPTNTVASVTSGISTAMMLALGMLGVTLYVVNQRRTRRA